MSILIPHFDNSLLEQLRKQLLEPGMTDVGVVLQLQ